MSEDLHVGNIGVQIKLTILDDDNTDSVVNLSSATSLDISIRKPDGTLLSVTGSLYTDGTDGVIYYIIADGDLDQSGVYKIQANISIGANFYNSNILTFKVLCNL